MCFCSFTTTVNHVSNCEICHEVYIPYAIDRYNMMGEQNEIKTKSIFILSLSGVLLLLMLGSKRNPCLLSIYYVPGTTIFMLSYLIPLITFFIHNTTEDWEGQVTSPRTSS